MERTAEQQVQHDHDLEFALDVATRTEKAMCKLMATMVSSECENGAQKMIAAAILTAMMVAKFGEAKLAVADKEWGAAVDQLVARLRPLLKEEALDVRFGQQS